MFVLATGNAFDGIHLFGPFDSHEEAEEAAEDVHDDWWIVMVEKGDEK